MSLPANRIIRDSVKVLKRPHEAPAASEYRRELNKRTPGQVEAAVAALTSRVFLSETSYCAAELAYLHLTEYPARSEAGLSR